MLGGLLIIIGFIAGNYFGILLSLSGHMQNNDGTVSQKKQMVYAALIAVSSLMIIAGQYIYSADHSY